MFLFQKSKFSFVHLVLFYSISFLIQEDQSSLWGRVSIICVSFFFLNLIKRFLEVKLP